MDRNTLLYIIDLVMGIFFVTSLITGLLKFTLLLRLPALNNIVLPSATISDIHDWSGIMLVCFVFIHLYTNRRWIATMTRKILGAPRQSS